MGNQPSSVDVSQRQDLQPSPDQPPQRNPPDDRITDNRDILHSPANRLDIEPRLHSLTLGESYSDSWRASSPLSGWGGRRESTSLRAKGVAGVPTIVNWTMGGNRVYVTGSFNGWKEKIPLVKSSHDFTTVIELPHGTHRLKFIVDDEWKCSTDYETATDPNGNLVNYIEVVSDEEDIDICSTTDPLEQNSPPGSYAADIPHYEEQPTRAQPPSLPPHLEKVLLNSHQVSREDNSVLPVPNHVVLNHLYACSIRDGVMALACTERYRKKYITVMFYKPV
ncbi:uncharacterized protein VTP21DRAFT_11639 [Calcarisporiella thermophila]|uniref:uncharacterized protein n=1 Tax=Calcarisporiella thermophila TaxID=911321 RepID=UPI003743DA86